jgi:hypothetical protein
MRACSARGLTFVHVDMLTSQRRAQLQSTMWGPDQSGADDVFVVLDGARDERIPRRVEGYLDQKACLYEGDLTRDLANAAPYLLRLFRDDRFCRQLLDEGWGNAWGVFVVANTSMNSLRKHFRTFMVVRGPSGQRLIFRWYDPRVLRSYLPTCNLEELRAIFGPIRAFIVEGRETGTAIRFSFDGERLSEDVVTLP